MSASVPYSFTLPTYTGRHLDPVRAAALERAIAAVPWPENGPLNVEEIITTAKKFEAYLAGEEAS